MNSYTDPGKNPCVPRQALLLLQGGLRTNRPPLFHFWQFGYFIIALVHILTHCAKNVHTYVHILNCAGTKSHILLIVLAQSRTFSHTLAHFIANAHNLLIGNVSNTCANLLAFSSFVQTAILAFSFFVQTVIIHSRQLIFFVTSHFSSVGKTCRKHHRGIGLK